MKPERHSSDLIKRPSLLYRKATPQTTIAYNTLRKRFALFLLLAILCLPACHSTPDGKVSNTTPSTPADKSDLKEFIKVEAPVLALTHATLIDGTGTPARTDQTVIIQSGVIQAVGKSSDVTVPADAKILDLHGYTLIPGLVGMHEHLFYAVDGGKRFANMGFSFPRLYLACGVTTIRTAGAVDWKSDLAIKQQIDAGEQPGPKTYLTSPYLTRGPSVPEDPAGIATDVNQWADQGATSFKAYTELRPAELAAAIQAAHKRGLKVTGHLGAVGFKEAATLGIDNLEHGLVVDTEFYSAKEPGKNPDWGAVLGELARMDVKGPDIQGLIKELVKRRVALTSTLAIFESLTGDGFPLDQRVTDAMSQDAQTNFFNQRGQIARQMGSLWRVLLRKEMQFERDFVRAGGHLMAGVDPTGWGGILAGFGDQRNLELLVEAGFTPEEAIHIATANGAEFLGESSRIGTLTPGKQADIVVIRGNPARQIADIQNVEMVFKDGIGYDTAKLIASVKGQVGQR